MPYRRSQDEVNMNIPYRRSLDEEKYSRRNVAHAAKSTDLAGRYTTGADSPPKESLLLVLYLYIHVLPGRFSTVWPKTTISGSVLCVTREIPFGVV
ncbi:hypothetical protein PoB_006899200 [Plakobranchus ocellatus]|uniref:Uncharacterized protein n=1 Tax=Plakobranchus ocellatus TaxID=259542 RepID=A0AAV4DEN6_9GAST|nr:hypothetical protein PoB_006899200 [Plakobranchus ocellatus]